MSEEEIEEPEAPVTASRGAAWRALLQLAKPYRYQFVFLALLALASTAADLITPLIYREAINDIAGLFVPGGDLAEPAPALDDDTATTPVALPPAHHKAHAQHRSAPHREPHHRGHVAPRTANQTLRTLLLAVAALLVLNLAAHALELWSGHRATVLGSRLERDVIVRTFSQVLSQPLSFFSQRSSGGLTKQIDQLDKISPVVSAFAHELAPEVVRTVGILAIMLTQSWKLTLVTLVTLPPYFWIVRRSARRLETGLDAYYERWEGITGRIHDALAAIKTVKLSGAEQREQRRLGGEADEAFADYLVRNRLANRYLFVQSALTYISQALALGYGGYLVLRHQLTPGDVVMFVAYLDKLYSPIDSLSSLAVGLQQQIASLSRAVRLMQTPGEARDGESPAAGGGRIEFDAVRFSYGDEREILRGVSFSLPAGSVTALVGPSGAGKTTVVDLLLKLYAPSHGEIRLDGQSVAALDAPQLRSLIGVVAADGAVFRGSIADNIRYKRADAGDAEVLQAALSAGLGPTLQRLPSGLATEIGERGAGLSLGERQRVQIARILVSRPRVLVLDEATANLDFATEAEVRRALLEREHPPTTLVVAHRYAMVRDAQQVIVLDAGRVVDVGTPEALRARCTWFAQFAAAAQGDVQQQI